MKKIILIYTKGMKKYLYSILIFLITPLLAGPYQSKDYSYLFGKLEGISTSLLKMHITLY